MTNTTRLRELYAAAELHGVELIERLADLRPQYKEVCRFYGAKLYRYSPPMRLVVRQHGGCTTEQQVARARLIGEVLRALPALLDEVERARNTQLERRSRQDGWRVRDH